MRLFHFPVAFLIALNLLAQDAPRPILVSHDLVDGPLGGEHRVKDLQVFENGKVVHETQYFADPFEAPAWRAQWVGQATTKQKD